MDAEEKYWMIKELTTEELEAELKKREERKKSIVMLENPDLEGLKTNCENIINGMVENEYDIDDIRDSIFDTVMETLYGEEVLEKLNE